MKMNTDIQTQPEVNGSESNATTAAENLEPQIQPTIETAPAPLPNPKFRRVGESATMQPSEAVEQPIAPPAQRTSHKDHMTWLRDISAQICEHYEKKTGNKLSKPISNALFARDMNVWFSARQKQQAEWAKLEVIDPEPLDPTVVAGQQEVVADE
jgi:hypothetical protein